MNNGKEEDKNNKRITTYFEGNESNKANFLSLKRFLDTT